MTGGQQPGDRFAKVVELSAKGKGPRARDPHRPADARLPEVRRGELFFGPRIPLAWVHRFGANCTNQGAAWMVATELWHLAWFHQHSRQNRVRSARVRFNSSRHALFPECTATPRTEGFEPWSVRGSSRYIAAKVTHLGL